MKFSKKAKPARIHDAKPRFTFGKALVMVSLLVSCADNVRRPLPPEPERVQMPQVEPVGDCIERYFESDFSVDPSFGRISRNKMSREMRKSIKKMFSRMENEDSGYYAEFFRKARYSNGDLMFPNAADVIQGTVFPDENSRRLAGRRMAKSMRPRRFPNAYSLLHSMPKTAVALVDRVNKSGSGMDVKHAEDIAGFFRMLIGFQNRMGAQEKACDFVPNMSREQLNELDSYYSDRILNWNNPVTGKRVCTDCKRSIESGEFQKFGIVEFPRGLDSGFCE